MGFILQALKEPGMRALLTGLCLLGIELMIGVRVFAAKLAAVERHKYDRCKELETVLRFKRHTSLQYVHGSSRVTCGILVALFLAAWALTLGTMWCTDAGQHPRQPGGPPGHAMRLRTARVGPARGERAVRVAEDVEP